MVGMVNKKKRRLKKPTRRNKRHAGSAPIGRPRKRAARVDVVKELGISLPTHGEIARGTGLCVSQVSLMLRGLREPKLGTAMRVSAFLGVSLDRLAAVLMRAKDGRALVAHPDTSARA